MAKKVMEYCVESCRGSSLASHTAASLVFSAKKKAPEFAEEFTEAARLLRLCESLARTATALLVSCSTTRGGAPSEASRGASLSEPVARADADSAGPAQKEKKKKKKRNKKNKDSSAPEVLPYDEVDAKMEVDGRPGPYFRPGAAAHMCHAAMSPASPSLGHVSHDDHPESSRFPVGAQVFLTGLSSRADLVGKPAAVLSWNAASARYAVKLTASGESILVRPCNMQPSIFGNVLGNS